MLSGGGKEAKKPAKKGGSRKGKGAAAAATAAAAAAAADAAQEAKAKEKDEELFEVGKGAVGGVKREGGAGGKKDATVLVSPGVKQLLQS